MDHRSNVCSVVSDSHCCPDYLGSQSMLLAFLVQDSGTDDRDPSDWPHPSSSPTNGRGKSQWISNRSLLDTTAVQDFISQSNLRHLLSSFISDGKAGITSLKCCSLNSSKERKVNTSCLLLLNYWMTFFFNSKHITNFVTFALYLFFPGKIISQQATFSD